MSDASTEEAATAVADPISRLVISPTFGEAYTLRRLALPADEGEFAILGRARRKSLPPGSPVPAGGIREAAPTNLYFSSPYLSAKHVTLSKLSDGVIGYVPTHEIIVHDLDEAEEVKSTQLPRRCIIGLCRSRKKSGQQDSEESIGLLSNYRVQIALGYNENEVVAVRLNTLIMPYVPYHLNVIKEILDILIDENVNVSLKRKMEDEEDEEDESEVEDSEEIEEPARKSRKLADSNKVDEKVADKVTNRTGSTSAALAGAAVGAVIGAAGMFGFLSSL